MSQQSDKNVKNKEYSGLKFLKAKKDNKEEELKDCIYTKEELDIDAEIQLEDQKKFNYKSTIQQLDAWDTEHLIKKKSNLMNLFRNFVENNFGNLKERWAHNKKSDRSLIRTETNKSINNSNSKILSSKKGKNRIINNKIETEKDENKIDNQENYSDFFDNEERDHICILLQNINIFRKKFDFTIFIKSTENKKNDTIENINLNENEFEHNNQLSARKLLENGNLNQIHEMSVKSITRNAFSSVNFNNKSYKDTEINNLESKLNKNNLQKLNTLEKDINYNINKKTNLNSFLFNNDSPSKLFLIKKDKDFNEFNSSKTINLQTEYNIKENNKYITNDINKDVLINQNNKQVIKTIIDSKDRRLNTQQNLIRQNLHSINKEGIETFPKNLFTDNAKDSLENNFTKLEIINAISNSNFNNKFKIPFEIKPMDTLETISNTKNDNYKNKNYLKSLAIFKKDLQISDNIMFLNKGNVLNTNSNEKEKINKIHFSNINVFSILNNNINNQTRLATSYDTRKPKLNINYEFNTNEKNEIMHTKSSKITNKFNESNQNIYTTNSNQSNSLKNTTMKINCKIDENDKPNINQTEGNNVMGVIGKDGSLKLYLSLMEKYMKFKDNKAFENLDSVDNYKKIIKNRIEKENIVRKDVINMTKMIYEKKHKRKSLNKEKCDIVIKINRLKEKYANEVAHYKKEKEIEEKVAENIYYNQNNILSTKFLFINNINNQTKTTNTSRTKVLDNNSRVSPVRNLYRNLIKKNSTGNQNSNQNDGGNKSPISKNLNTNTNIVGKDISNQNNIKDFSVNYSNNNNLPQNNQESDASLKKKSNKNIFNGLQLLKGSTSNKNNNNTQKNTDNINNAANNNQKTLNTGDRAIYANVDAKYDEIFKKLEMDFEPKKIEHEKHIEKIDKYLAHLDTDIQVLKSNLENIFEKQREYYIDLLGRGIDVRSEGLTWIVKRLIELNAVIDHGIFPRFLDKEQIEYIIFISFKSVEIAQINILIKMLRSKQTKENKSKKNLHEINLLKLTKQITDHQYVGTNNENNNNEKIDKRLNDIDKTDSNKVQFDLEYEEKIKIKNLKFFEIIKHEELCSDNISNIKNNNSNITKENKHKLIEYNRNNSFEMFFNTSFTGKNSHFYLKSFSEKALSIFDHIFQKYEIIGKSKINHFLQDKKTLDKINLIKEKLRKLSIGNSSDKENLEEIGEKTNKFLQFFMNSYDEKAYLHEIVNLKDVLKKFENEIQIQKQFQLNVFSKRYESLKSTGEFSIQNELIYSCLFGNGIAY